MFDSLMTLWPWGCLKYKDTKILMVEYPQLSKLRYRLKLIKFVMWVYDYRIMWSKWFMIMFLGRHSRNIIFFYILIDK